MKLAEWLAAQGADKDSRWLADELEVPYHTVRRLIRNERKPDDDTMRKIVVRTGGQVTANDFYELADVLPGKYPAKPAGYRPKPKAAAKKKAARR